MGGGGGDDVLGGKWGEREKRGRRCIGGPSPLAPTSRRLSCRVVPSPFPPSLLSHSPSLQRLHEDASRVYSSLNPALSPCPPSPLPPPPRLREDAGRVHSSCVAGHVEEAGRHGEDT